jgi:hypothetical protein
VALAWVLNGFWLIHADRAAVAARPAGEGLDRLAISTLPQFQKTVSHLLDTYPTNELYISLDTASLTAKAGRALQAISWSEPPTLTLFVLGQPAIYAHSETSAIPLSARAAQINYPDNDTLAFDVIPAYTRAQLADTPRYAVDWPTAQGLTLLGYDVENTPPTLTTYWLMEALAEERGQWLYAPYAHLINRAGQMVANVGGPGLPGYYYRPAEAHLIRMALPELPPGEYQLEVGLYDGVHGLGATFLPPAAPPQPAYTASLIWP